MRTFAISVALTLSALAACNSKEGSGPGQPKPVAPTTSTPPAPPPSSPASADRSKDPAFALREENGKYVGRVAAACPWANEPAGDPGKASGHAIPTLASTDYKLVDGHLEIKLPYGGCPQWAGYTVVTGPGSPLAFYVCDEIQHDTCELSGFKTWSFDISAALKTNNATAVTFAVPTGVH